MKFFKKLIAVLTATSLVTVSGLSSVCMAVKDHRDLEHTFVDQIKAGRYYALKMLQLLPKDEGLKKSDKDGNYFKKDKLNDEEKKIYDEIVKQVDEIKDSVDKDDSSNLPKDCKLAKAIFFWVRNNIKYDKSSDSEFDEYENEKVNPNRKPQDALTVFKNGMGVCSGSSNLAKLMMNMAGLSCMIASNNTHMFNVVWLDSLGGWALFDASLPEYTKKDEIENANKYEVSPDRIGLCNNFTAVSDTTRTLQDNNEYFLAQGLGENLVYFIGNSVNYFHCSSICLDGVKYFPSASYFNTAGCTQMGCYLELSSCKKDILVDDKLNFDVFYKNFVRVDISQSQINKTIKQGDFEFNLSADGEKSKLEIKPLEGNVNHDEVEIPDELVPFLADIDEFNVASSIKTVKYDLLRKKDSLKKDAVPNGVRFEQINS